MSKNQASQSVANKSNATDNQPFADKFIYRGRIIEAMNIDLPNCKAMIARIDGEFRLNTESTSMGRVKMLAMRQIDEDIDVAE